MTVKSYPARVKKSLLPKSRSPLIHLAILEWYYTGEVLDAGERSKHCELCDQEHLRYQYQIANETNGNKLWVGSSCILKFGVRVFYQGKPVFGDQASGVLESDLQAYRKQACVLALESLMSKPGVNRALVEGVQKAVGINGTVTPKQLGYVAWQLGKHQIPHDLKFFKLNLRKERYRNDLLAMKDWQVKAILPALSSAQMKTARELGIIQ